MVPAWLHTLALVSLSFGFLCAAAIVWDEVRHPQHMWIMNLVWPLAALFASAAAVWVYLRYGHLAKNTRQESAAGSEKPSPLKIGPPFSIFVVKGTSHCGAGCCLGDILAEWLAFFVPAVAGWFGWHGLFSNKIFAVWAIDYIFAFIIGIAFQYFTIKPMRNLSVGQGLFEAVKADAASLTAWQVGMYGFMAIAQFYMFRHLLGVRLEVDSVEFWFMMQLAMIAGFFTSYPVNWWLISIGIKEKM